MKILLVLPAADNVRVMKDGEVPDRKMLRFSILPLTSVATLTPREHEVEICDENVELVDFDTDADLVGISFMTALAPRAYELAHEFKKRGKVTIAGGYHPTLLPGEAAVHFDSVIVGDAEELWPKALQDITEKKLEKIYRHETLPCLDNTPPPRRDLMKKTASLYATVNAVQAGRGCTHGCKYCSVTAFHRQTYRTRPQRCVLDELIRIEDKEFIFVDDNIIADPEYAERLFKAMIPLKKRWVSQCSITIADNPNLLRLAAKAGCKGLFIGIESVSKDNLEAVEKGFNDPEGYRERIKRIHKHGIGIIAGMIVGMDHDEPAVFERTLKFLDKSGIDALQLNIMTPLPGTPLFEEMKRQNRVTDMDWSKYDFRHVVIEPARMSSVQLQAGADWLYNEFYSLERIFKRTLRTLLTVGISASILTFKLGMTYRYDNIREGITGYNPARGRQEGGHKNHLLALRETFQRILHNLQKI